MPKTLEVIFENGVFKPLEKVNLKEHQHLEISISGIGSGEDVTLPSPESPSVFNIINLFEADVSDLSQNHNSYLYSQKD